MPGWARATDSRCTATSGRRGRSRTSRGSCRRASWTTGRSRDRTASPDGSEVVLRLRQHRTQAGLDVVELLRAHDERRRELDDGVAAVVGTAVEAGVEERLGEEPAQQPLGLGVVEGLAGGLVLDELDAVEVAGATDVADERQVEQLVERRLEDRGVGPDAVVEALALEDVEVGHGDGRRDRVP